MIFCSSNVISFKCLIFRGIDDVQRLWPMEAEYKVKLVIMESVPISMTGTFPYCQIVLYFLYIMQNIEWIPKFRSNFALKLNQKIVHG